MKRTMNLYKSKVLIVVLLFAGSWTHQSLAQSELSLTNAIERGLKNNYDVLIEGRRVDRAVNSDAWGEAGRYPRVDLNFNQNNAVTDNIKTATPFQLQDQIISNSINPQLQVGWTLFEGNKVNITKYRLEQLQKESKGNADIVVSNTVQAIVLGYYNAVLERERSKQFETQMSLSRAKYLYTMNKKELGGAVTTDLLLEETNYLTDSSNWVAQELAYRNAVKKLNFLMGETDPDLVWELTDSLALESYDYSYEELVARLNSDNIDIKKQYLSQSVIEANKRISRSERYPKVFVDAFYNYNQNRNDLSNASFPTDDGFVPGPADPLTAITGSYGLNFRLTFNLYNGGRINRAIRNAEIDLDIGNIQIDKLRNSLMRDLSLAYDNYMVRKQQYGINKRNREVSELNLEISTDKYRSGTMNQIDFRVIQNNNLAASIRELQSIYSLVESKIELMRLTGGIIAEYPQTYPGD